MTILQWALVAYVAFGFMLALIVGRSLKFLTGDDEASEAAWVPLELDLALNASEQYQRERSAENGTAVPTAGGGVIPTRSLQPTNEGGVFARI